MIHPVPEEVTDKAAELLKGGGLIAFPTETYYGLAVDPFNESALQRLFRVKNRPAIKPVLVLVSGPEQLPLLTNNIPAQAEHLMNKFWPGPLTLVLPALDSLSPILTGGTSTVGVRHSPNPVAISLLEKVGRPITATSANRSGESAAVCAEDVAQVFRGELDMVLDGGRTPGEMGSTLIGFESAEVKCIREGCLPFKKILEVL